MSDDLVGVEVQFKVLDEDSGELTCGTCGADIAEEQPTCACGAIFVGEIVS